MIENNSKLNIKDRYKNIPLYYACKRKNISKEIIEYLIEEKSDLNLIARSQLDLMSELQKKLGKELVDKLFFEKKQCLTF